MIRRIRLRFSAELVPDDLSDRLEDGSAQSWFLVSRESRYVRDVFYDIGESFALEGRAPHGLVLKLDDVELAPSLSVEIIQSGDLISVHRREAKQLKRPRSSSDIPEQHTPKKKQKKSQHTGDGILVPKDKVVTASSSSSSSSASSPSSSDESQRGSLQASNNKRQKVAKQSSSSNSREKLLDLSQHSDSAAADTFKSNSIDIAQNINERTGIQHVEFDDDGNPAAARVIHTSVFLRTPVRKTVEGWESSGWRVNNPARDARRNRPPKSNRRRREKKVKNSHVLASLSEPNFDSLPKLERDPKAGDILAFKLWEVSNRWTPELSVWKTGTVLAFDSGRKVLTIEFPDTSMIESKSNDEAHPDEQDLNLFAKETFGSSNVTEVELTQLIDLRLTKS